MLFLVKSNLVKLATSRTVILPPTVSALCCVNRKRLRVSIVVIAQSLCKREKERERNEGRERERSLARVRRQKNDSRDIFANFFQNFSFGKLFLTGRPAVEQAPKLPKIFFKRTNQKNELHRSPVDNTINALGTLFCTDLKIVQSINIDDHTGRTTFMRWATGVTCIGAN